MLRKEEFPLMVKHPSGWKSPRRATRPDYVRSFKRKVREAIRTTLDYERRHFYLQIAYRQHHHCIQKMHLVQNIKAIRFIRMVGTSCNARKTIHTTAMDEKFEMEWPSTYQHVRTVVHLTKTIKPHVNGWILHGKKNISYSFMVSVTLHEKPIL